MLLPTSPVRQFPGAPAPFTGYASMDSIAAQPTPSGSRTSANHAVNSDLDTIVDQTHAQPFETLPASATTIITKSEAILTKAEAIITESEVLVASANRMQTRLEAQLDIVHAAKRAADEQLVQIEAQLRQAERRAIEAEAHVAHNKTALNMSIVKNKAQAAQHEEAMNMLKAELDTLKHQAKVDEGRAACTVIDYVTKVSFVEVSPGTGTPAHGIFHGSVFLAVAFVFVMGCPRG